MNPQNKWLRVTGIVIHVLIAGLLLFAASGKVLGAPPPEVQEMLSKTGIGDNIRLIGFGELACAVLLLLPWTSPLGVLMTSGFWGGTICFHMGQRENYTFQAVLLLATWIGGYLRGSVPLFFTSLKSTASKID